jgi:DNA-binding LacI/PurR family transcriptional regulator
MPISLSDVAVKAGVSSRTASCVLNDKTEARIAAVTQERVRLAARELGYRPNRMARSLRMGRTGTVRLMVSRLTNPFFANLAQGIEIAARKEAWDVLADADFESSARGSRQEKLHGWPVEGVLMWSVPYQNAADYLGESANDTPVVYLGYARTDDSDWVALDFYDGAKTAVERLIARGCRRIAYLAATDEAKFLAFDPKYRACREVCHRHRMEIQLLVPQILDPVEAVAQVGLRTAGFELGLRLSREPAATRSDAVLCASDVLAIAFYNGVRRAGLTVPGDVAIIGFDGIEEGACMQQTLTTVVKPVDVMSREAVRLLRNRIGGGVSSPQRVLLPVDLRIGETA